MGIPRFYRWISERYPQINQLISDVSLLPEFDNLYLDMNGIIHQCTHPNDLDHSESVSERDQVLGIFTYIDRIVTHIVKPKKLLYLAVDGVAPRAKLNQQRSRRFRAGLDLMRAKQELMKSKDSDEEENVSGTGLFDSNCITPGTEFMARISKHLKYFIRRKIKDDPMWQNLTVIFSGHEVPGEGEHKIVEFIRNIKGQPGYPPNVRHCMYGSDADLMLLGIATHEPHFTLLREVVDWNMNSRKNQNAKKIIVKQTKEQQWQMVHLSLFREYLDFELRVDVPFYDTERALDDFIFVTFFLGNDFIPHSPTLEISEDAIAVLLKTYRELLPKWGGYLTDSGKLVDPSRLESIFDTIGSMEETILITRAEEQAKFNQRRKGGREVISVDSDSASSVDDEIDFEAALFEALDAKKGISLDVGEEESNMIILKGSKSFQEKKLGYYNKKFGISRDQPDLMMYVRRAYIEAMLWCLEYYFQGPPSWSWFYPFHYAPMISDMTNLKPIVASIKFTLGSPLKPFEQLLSCLPAASSALLPTPYRYLMTHEESPVIDFYPLEFDIDMEGKRNEWEGVNILPFIDSKRLIDSVAKHAPNNSLSESELERNDIGHVVVFRYDQAIVDNIQSSFPQAGLPDILACNSSMLVFNLPPPPEGGFKSGLVPGVTLPMPGFPSLRTLPISRLSIQSIGLNCFGMVSRKETLILHIDGHKKMKQILEREFEEIGKELLNANVYVNWPNLHESKVIAISTDTGEYRLRDNKLSLKRYTGTEIDNWKQIALGETRKYFTGREVPGSGGMDIGAVKVLVHVVVLQGMIRDAKTGALKKKFGIRELIIPAQLVLPNSPAEDPRFVEHPPLQLVDRFPVGGQVVVTFGKHRGSSAQIKSIENNRTLTLSVLTSETEPSFGRVIANQIVDRYFPGYQLSKKLGISSNVLGQIVGSVMVNPRKYNIGLNLKVKKDFKLLGYCRLSSNASERNESKESSNVWLQNDAVRVVGHEDLSTAEDIAVDSGGAWEYSERALHVIAAYKRKFPMVFESLERLPYSRGYAASDFFPGVKDLKKQCEDIKLWLSQLETHKLPLVPVLTTAMPKQAVSAIEQASNVRQSLAANSATEIIVKGMLPENVFKSNPTANHDISSILNTSNRRGAIKPRLGDRVINLTARSVPFGIRGSVVGIHPDSGCVEVVFDIEFVGGTTLNGLCSNYRGKLVPWASLYTIMTNDNKQKKNQTNSSSGKSSGRSRTPTPKRQQSEPKKLLQKSEPLSTIPSEKKNNTGNGKSKRRDELKVSDADTSGTTSYFQQLQYQAETLLNQPPNTQPSPSKPNSSEVTDAEQKQFQSLLNRAFQGRTVQPPHRVTQSIPQYQPYVATQEQAFADTKDFPTLEEANSVPRCQPKSSAVAVEKGSAGSELMPTQILHKKFINAKK